jgi:two-component system sensor histidine kinase BaeS
VNAIAMVAAGLVKAGRTPGAAEMHEAATLANRMIDDLMAVVSIESGTLELYPTAVSLGALADEIVSIFRPPATVRGIELIARVEPAGLTAQVDRYRLLQAVSNVVANAVKFSPNGGRINIDVKEAGDDVEIVISDEGPGIPAEETEHIFDRFWRSPRRRQRSTGAGLGLTITRGCVEAHRGRIRVDSQPGRGATFTIAVPKRSTDGVGAVLAPLGPSEPGQGKE